MINSIKVLIHRRETPFIALFASIFLTALYFNVLFDILLLALLFLSSYCIGSKIPVKLARADRIWVQTAAGLGAVGTILYFLILFGLAKVSLYVVLLVLPLILSRKRLFVLFKNCITTIKKTNSGILFPVALTLISILLIIAACRPISTYDALAKHVAVVERILQNNTFYLNVVESHVYGESSVLQYTYSAMLASFGAYKAITIFNAFCLMLCFALLFRIARNIFKGFNSFFLLTGVVLFPLFFRVSTLYNVDILQSVFLLSAALIAIKSSPKLYYHNLPIAGLLFGCAMASKLTSAQSILVVGLVFIAGSLIYAIKTKKFIGFIARGFAALLAMCVAYITHPLIIWYKTGNPFLPFFNSFFKSPYFETSNFTDPFNNSPLGLSFGSLIKMVFHTSQNIEMHDFGLGFILLLVVLIPVALVFYRKKEYITAVLIAPAIYLLCTFFTYNLRYFITAYMLSVCVIVCSVGIILSKLPKKWDRIITVMLAFALLLPNSYYIYKAEDIKQSLIPDERRVVMPYGELLEKVNYDGCRVLGVGATFRGDYKGEYYTTMWHNTFLSMIVLNGSMSLDDYLFSFDYVLMNNPSSFSYELQNKVYDYIKEHPESFDVFDFSNDYVLYKVIPRKPEYKVLTDVILDEPQRVTRQEQKSERLPELMDSYVLIEDIEYTGKTPATARFQINWIDKNGKMIDCSIALYNLSSGRNTYTSNEIKAPKGAEYGILYITPHDADEIMLYGYKVEAAKTTSAVDAEIEKLNSRQRVKGQHNG